MWVRASTPIHLCDLLTSAVHGEVLGAGSEQSRPCSEVCTTAASVCVGDVLEGAEWVSSSGGGCVGPGVGERLCDGEVTCARADRLPAARDVLAFEAGLFGAESLVMLVSETGCKLLGFL